jgi:hypothetical protein
MKTFQKFNEDIQSLRRNLDTISQQDAPAERLAQRRRIAAERSKTSASDFTERQQANVQAQKEKHAQMRQDYEERQQQLRAKRQAEQERKEAERQARLERQNQQEDLQLEQHPHMPQTPFNIMKSKEQTRGSISRRNRIRTALDTKERTQQRSHNAILRAIMSR